MSSCPTREALERWANDREPRGEIAEHVESCDRCRERAARVRADSRLLSGLRAIAGQPAASGGARVPGYRIEGELRRGGQGVVFRAVQEATKRNVALKVLLGGRDATARERKRFEREIELASRLRHPFIVTVFDSGAAAGEAWYAMELVDGVPLDEWLRRVDRPLRERVELFARICSAVAYAHRGGVIHRDLKPANIVIDADDKPRILDFGAARDAESPDELRVTAPGEFLGTLDYAAPEQLRGDAHEIDTRTDVHALGLMLYELCTGRLPFERAASLHAIVEHAERGVVAPPSQFAREVDGELDAIALRALERDPAARYGTAEALERDVAHYLAGEPLETRAHSAWYVLRRSIARHRGKVLVASLATAAAAAFTILWWTEHARAQRQLEQAALVRSVLQDMLGAADPQRMGADVRLLEVYDLAARNVERALAGAPDVQAEVELTIGDTYRRLLRPAEGEKHLRRALARFREIDDGRQLEIARCANLLGLALAAQNQTEATAVAEEALAIRERELPAADPRIAEARRTVAIAILSQYRDGDALRAQQLLESALASFRAAYGDEHVEVADTKYWRSRAAADLTEVEAERLLAEANATFERAAEPDPRAIPCFNAYSAMLQQRGRFDEARERLDRSFALAHRLFGDALATDLLRRYARLEFARGDAVAAEQLSRQAVARDLERCAGQRPQNGEHFRALAQRVEQPGSPSAEPPYAEAFAALRSVEGDGAFELAQWINGIALTLDAQGRAAATEPMLREALHIRCRAMGADCPVRQRTIELLSQALFEQGRGGDAVELLEESIATFERQGASTSSEAERANQLLAACRAQPATKTISTR